MNTHSLDLHPASERGSGASYSFQSSFQGRMNGKNVTFAYGRGVFASLILVANGHMSEEAFRAHGHYIVGKLNRATPYRRLQRGRLYTLTQHGSTTSDRESNQFASELPILNVQ